jgi:hypothetical protein
MKLCAGSQRAPSTGRAAPAVTVPPAVRGLGSACPAVRHGVARGRVRLPPPDAYIAERAGPAEARQKFHVLSLLAESVELNVRLRGACLAFCSAGAWCAAVER